MHRVGVGEQQPGFAGAAARLARRRDFCPPSLAARVPRPARRSFGSLAASRSSTRGGAVGGLVVHHQDLADFRLRGQRSDRAFDGGFFVAHGENRGYGIAGVHRQATPGTPPIPASWYSRGIDGKRYYRLGANRMKEKVLGGAALLGAIAVLYFFAMPSYRQSEPSIAGRRAPDFALEMNGQPDAPVGFARQGRGAGLLGDVVPAVRRRGSVAQRACSSDRNRKAAWFWASARTMIPTPIRNS